MENNGILVLERCLRVKGRFGVIFLIVFVSIVVVWKLVFKFKRFKVDLFFSLYFSSYLYIRLYIKFYCLVNGYFFLK